MIVDHPRAALRLLLLALVSCTAAGPAPAQHARPTTTSAVACTVDLQKTGQMADVLSNALMRGLEVPELRVRSFLDGAGARVATGPELLAAAARHFEIDAARLSSAVERYRHCNCSHEGGELHQAAKPVAGEPAAGHDVVPLSSFAADVVLHVVLHELGHALVREFDLPILGNEETMADAFATHYLTTYLPERAAEVLEARARSLMLEANDVPRADWPVRGEHDNDARRAFQIAALAVAADPVKYANVAKAVAMSDADMRRAEDYGADVHRSWRRILAPLWMTDGAASKEARVVGADQFDSAGTTAPALLDVLRTVVGRFDWHSQVTIRFVAGDGGAAWSRSTRSITVHTGYVRRFAEQGKRVKS